MSSLYLCIFDNYELACPDETPNIGNYEHYSQYGDCTIYLAITFAKVYKIVMFVFEFTIINCMYVPHLTIFVPNCSMARWPQRRFMEGFYGHIWDVPKVL